MKSSNLSEQLPIADALRPENVRLEHRNILDIQPDFGQFDYIIVHGVYSWVPDEVQAHLLRLCNDNRAADGVAYIWYNTDPGWHMRGMIRDMMCYRAPCRSASPSAL
ncbi:MAG: class I SAM-dependent methyltransferase [Pirellulales bacterium]